MIRVPRFAEHRCSIDVFDWFDARYKAHTIWFGRDDYGGERDILLLPCATSLVSITEGRSCGQPTTAARDRRDPRVLEIVADFNLRIILASRWRCGRDYGTALS